MKKTEKTLLEQMQISDLEISKRKELLGLKPKVLSLLTDINVVIHQHIDSIVEEFYERQTEVDEISLLIGDADTLRRLRTAQRHYVLDLFSGSYDAEYVNNRLRIGMVHKRIGVEPKLYLSAVQTLKEVISSTLSVVLNDRVVLDRTLDALDKLMYFDTTLVFDTYIDSLVSEIETEKKRTEAYARSLEEKVAERTRQLEELARIDPLTGVYNRRAMQELLNRELRSARRRQSVISVIYLDVDKFKQINDTLGHIAGDEVLQVLGKILREQLREIDIPCRFGGDEFCVILPDCSVEHAQEKAHEILSSFVVKYPDLSLSIGIAETGPEEYMDEQELLLAADKKMYEAKNEGGDQVAN